MGDRVTVFRPRGPSGHGSNPVFARVSRRARWLAVIVLAFAAAFGPSGATPAVGATRTWTGLGVTANWSDPVNWAGGVPGAADVAVFGPGAVKSVVVNASISVAGITVDAGYTGTLTQAAGRTITVGATGLSQTDGVVVGGDSAITINGPLTLAGGTFTSTSATLSVGGSFTQTNGAFIPNGGIVAFIGGAATIDPAPGTTLGQVRFSTGTKTIVAGDTLTVEGSLTLTDGSINGGTVAARGALSQASAFDGGTGTVRIEGTLDQTFTGAATTTVGQLPNLVIDKPSGTLTLAGTIRTTRAWTYAGGTIDPGTSLVVFDGAPTITGSHSLAGVTFRATGTKTIVAGDTLTVEGSLTLTDGSINGGTVAARGALSQASAFDGGTGTVRIEGTLDQTFTGAATTTVGQLPNLVIDKPSGTLTLAGTIRTTRAWTYAGGTLDPGTSLVVFDGAPTITGSHSLANLRFGGASAKTIAAGDTLTALGQVDLVDGDLDGGTLEALADVTVAATFDGETATLLINGTADQTLTGSNTLTAGELPNLVIDKPSGTLTLAGTIRAVTSAWTYIGGTVEPGTSLVVFDQGVTIAGSHALSDVTFRGGSGSIVAGDTLTVEGSLTLTDGSINGGTVAARGALSQASAFDGGTGTVRIEGTLDQTFTGAATTTVGQLPNLVIDKPSGTLTLAGTIRTTRAWTYAGGTIDPGTSLVVFDGAPTITGSHSLAGVTFRATGTKTIVAGDTLTVEGSLTLTDGSINGGTVAARGALSQASAFDGGTGTVRIEGTLDQTFTGAATTTVGQLPNLVIDKPSGTLTLAGTIRTTRAWTYAGGTLDPGTSLVVFDGAPTITGSHSLAGVTFRATGTKTIVAGDTLTVEGSLTLTDGSINGGTVAARGALSQASAFDGGTGTVRIEGTLDQTFTGAATTTVGQLPNLVIDKPSGTLTLAGTIRTTRAWTYAGGTLDPGTSLVVFASGAAIDSAGAVFFSVTSSGAPVTLASGIVVEADLTIQTGTLTTGGHAVVVQGDLVVTGSLQASSSQLSVAGDVVTNGPLVAAVPGEVRLVGAAAQSIGGTVAPTLHDLVIANPAGASLASDIAVDGSLTLTSGTLAIGPHRLTIRNALAGDPSGLVGGSSSSLAVRGSDPAIALPATIPVLGELVLDNPSGLTLEADVSIVAKLDLAAGRLWTDGSEVTLEPGALVDRTLGWVVGRLGKDVPSGASTIVAFEVGNSLAYAPVILTFDAVSASGKVVAGTTSGDHPAIGASILDPSHSANRYWTLTNGGAAFGSYAAELIFDPSDVDPGTDVASFAGTTTAGAGWSVPAVSARTATSTTLSGLTSFGDFALGEAVADLSVSIDRCARPRRRGRLCDVRDPREEPGPGPGTRRDADRQSSNGRRVRDNDRQPGDMQRGGPRGDVLARRDRTRRDRDGRRDGRDHRLRVDRRYRRSECRRDRRRSDRRCGDRDDDCDRRQHASERGRGCRDDDQRLDDRHRRAGQRRRS